MPLAPLYVQTAACGDNATAADYKEYGVRPPHLEEYAYQPRPYIPGVGLALPPSRLEEPAHVLVDRLFDAISRDDFSGVRALLCMGINPNVFTPKGTHVLFRAVIKAKEPAIVKLLLAAGADTRASDEVGNQVLHFWTRASTSNQDHSLEIGRALILAGADPNAARHDDGMTPLHNAVLRFNGRRGWHDFHRALLLVREGAEITAKTKLNQIPCNMVLPSNRVAWGRMMELLATGVFPGSEPGSWPVCDTPDCKWCV